MCYENFIFGSNQTRHTMITFLFYKYKWKEIIIFFMFLFMFTYVCLLLRRLFFIKFFAYTYYRVTFRSRYVFACRLFLSSIPLSDCCTVHRKWKIEKKKPKLEEKKRDVKIDVKKSEWWYYCIHHIFGLYTFRRRIHHYNFNGIAWISEHFCCLKSIHHHKSVVYHSIGCIPGMVSFALAGHSQITMLCRR